MVKRFARAALGLVLVACWSAFGATWTEDSFDDFADGTLDASGQNLYVSRDGKVRTIHRFDLNDDGWIDLLFNGTHDLIGILPSTQGSVASNRTVSHSDLAVEGALAVTAADLNKDGYRDLVFCPNRQGVQNARRFVTIIYGGPDGWPPSRSNGVLPTYDATDVAVVDLNRDTWPDIAVLNATAWLPGQPEGRIVRVYWGSDHGFILKNFHDFNNDVAIDAADFDGDGSADLAVLRGTKAIQIYWSQVRKPDDPQWDVSLFELPGPNPVCITAADATGDGLVDLVIGTDSEAAYVVQNESGRTWGDARIISAYFATHMAVGDVDDDGQVDLVLTRAAIVHAAGGEAIGAEKTSRGQVHVLWGSTEGFSNTRATTIDVPYATATAVGDLDGDGHNDLAVSVYQDEADTFATKAVLIFGDGGRTLNSRAAGPPVSGATDVLIVPAENGLPARAVFANSQGGHADERVDLQLYWGGADGFSTQRRLDIPFSSGYEATAADLNADGHADLVELCSGHAGGSTAEAMTQLGANIYWGAPGGIDPNVSTTVLREYNLYSSNTADLDKDGYLDLVLGAFAPPPNGGPDLLVIYYGSSEGFSTARRTAIPSEGRSSICALADLNQDQWLDIAVTSYDKDRVRIFWGGPQGFAPNNQQELHLPAPIELEVADLNADGRLDLIVGSYEDAVAHHHDTGLFILWGNAEGFREWNAQWLPGYTPLGLTVADWDADGYLDLFSAHYHGELTREQLPSYLYWGGPDGFATRNRTVFIGDSPSDALAADFDKDGRLDLALSCHSRDGDHASDSKVFYNDGHRFAEPSVTKLPTVGPHWMWTEDMGHIADRRWRQTYTSSVYEWNEAASAAFLTSLADTPSGASLIFQLRSAPDPAAIEKQPWRDANSAGATLDAADRALQYRAVFASDNGDRFPTLDRVTVELKR